MVQEASDDAAIRLAAERRDEAERESEEFARRLGEQESTRSKGCALVTTCNRAERSAAALQDASGDPCPQQNYRSDEKTQVFHGF